MAGMELASAARAAGALAEADILSRHNRLEFAHPLLRNVVYESIPPAQRALDHGRAAWLFSDPVADHERMAAHLLQAAPAGDARVVDVPLLRPLAEQAGPAGRGLLILLAYRAAMDGASHKEVVDLADHGLDDGRSLTAETDGLPLPFAMPVRLDR